jgi:hypothetical protein
MKTGFRQRSAWVRTGKAWGLAAFLLAALPVGTQAQYTFVTNGGTLTITRYTGSAGTLSIPSTLGGRPVTRIGSRAFKDCHSLTNVTIPNSIASIKAHAFSGCIGLERVALGNGVTRIGEDIFIGCTHLTEIKVDTFNPAYGSRAGILFDKSRTRLLLCPAGKAGSYEIPASVVRIGDRAFYGCTSLTNVVITNRVATIGDWAFGNCSGLAGATLSNNIASIGEGAFFGCSGLVSVAIGHAVSSIGAGAFFGCTGLAEINVHASNSTYAGAGGVLFNKAKTRLHFCPEGKTGKYAIPASVTRIGDRAFFACKQLRGVRIPAGVVRIGKSAFYGCDDLVSVTIPASVSRIGSAAFRNSTNLTSVYFRGNVPAIGTNLFSGVDTHATVYYVRGTTGWGTPFEGLPTRSVDAYEPDNNWTSAQRIRNGQTQRRSIHEAGNVDWAKFAVDSAGARHVLVETTGTSGDTQLWLFKANGTLVAYDNNGGAGRFSRIAAAALAPGTYFIKIQVYGNNGIIRAYKLRVNWTAP